MGEWLFVPEGRCDRSHSTRYRLLMAGLAQSAWDSATQKSQRDYLIDRILAQPKAS
jgi:hypothetical protein